MGTDNTPTTTQEAVSLLPQTLAQEMIAYAQKEIAACSKVTFTPEADAAKLDFIMSIALDKMKQLSKIDVRKELEKEKRKPVDVIDEETGVTRKADIELDNNIIALADVIQAESRITHMISQYAKIISSNLMNRRRLSGQWMGYRCEQTKDLGNMKLTQTIQLSGEQLLDELGAKTSDSGDQPVGQNITLTQTTETREVKIQNIPSTSRAYIPATDPKDIYTSEDFSDAE